jgi:hypothetical protein
MVDMSSIGWIIALVGGIVITIKLIYFMIKLKSMQDTGTKKAVFCMYTGSLFITTGANISIILKIIKLNISSNWWYLLPLFFMFSIVIWITGSKKLMDALNEFKKVSKKNG